MWMIWIKRIGFVLSLCGLAACTSWEGPRLHVQGTQALERGEYSQARETLSRAAALVEHPAQASQVENHLGLAYLGEGEEGLAVEAFRRAIDLDCRNEAAKHNLEIVTGERSEVTGIQTGESSDE